MKTGTIDIYSDYLNVSNLHFDFVNRIKACLSILLTGYLSFSSIPGNMTLNFVNLKEQEKQC
jgi:uncharacterized membrane protein